MTKLKMYLIKCIVATGTFILFTLPNSYASDKSKEIEIPLTNQSQINIEGSYRFLEIEGITGLHVNSLKTKAYIETSLLEEEKGCISFWMSPLEDMDKSPKVGDSRNIMRYPLISDYFPPREVDTCNFSIYYQGNHYPRVIARFTDGSFWAQMDYGLAPFVYAEDLPLQKGQWYYFVVSWNKPENTLTMYINGELVGHNFSAKSFKSAGNKLYIGNPLMVISHLKIQASVPEVKTIEEMYQHFRPQSNDDSDKKIIEIVTPQDKSDLDFELDESWKKTYECSFTREDEFKDWKFQTGDLFRDKFRLEITDEGLYWETPDVIHNESRGYLWCPVNVEGDQCIEYEFQVISPKGLALLIMCASGLQGEDIINDHGLKKTGSMGDMLSNYRNYHWEYVRRVEAMRTDIETQYVNKNPWGKSMYVGCIPRFEQNKWYKIRFMKTGDRLYGSIDGKTVFSVEDNPYDNNGPVMNSGRIVLRQMYHTAMKYRNFVIYKKQ